VGFEFKGISFGSKFNIRLNFEIQIEVEGTIDLPCSCHTCPNSLNFDIPIEVHYDVLNIKKLAAYLGIPGGILYEIITTLRDLFEAYDEVTSIVNCL